MFESSRWIRYRVKNTCVAEKYNPSPFLTRSFEVKKALVQAKLCICGFYEAAYFINGRVIPDSYRPTIPCTPSKAVVYNSYNVTELLCDGVNRIGILLAVTRSHPDVAKIAPCAIMQLDLLYADGSLETIVSDNSFKATTSSVVFTYRECGEIHDARLASPFELSRSSTDDSLFECVEVIEDFNCVFRTSDCPPIRKICEKDGVEISHGLFDFQTTTAGYVKVTVSGKKGSRIKLDYSERLLGDGKHVDMSTYMKDKKPCPSTYNSDEYILNGEKDTTFEQFFSIHGFRYVEVTGEYDSIKLCAVVCHTDMKRDSFFSCNNTLLNRIHDACANSIATCTQTFFVDNPKRDAAWVGDQMLSAEATSILFDSYDTHFENMLMCIDSLDDRGAIPSRVPSLGAWCYDNVFLGPDWSNGVAFLVPYYAYKYFGRREIVDAVWDTMNRSLDFFKTLSKDNNHLLNQYGTGDWSAVKSGCPLEIAMTVYYYNCADIMNQLALALGKDNTQYIALMNDIRCAYREKYVVDGKIQGKHISEFILPAYVGILDDDEIPYAVKTIADMIADDGFAFTFGCHGLRMIFDVLSENGYANLVYKVLTNDKALGYARNIRLGYDTVPERFDWERDGIYSLNHHFFACAAVWFYKYVAGIRINGFGYDDIEISPIHVDGIDSFDCSLHGIRVSLENRVITVSSPYPFSLSYGAESRKCDAGEHCFPFDR